MSHNHILLVDFHVQTSGLSTGTIAGIVAGSIASVIILILLVLWRTGFLGEKDIEDKGERYDLHKLI